MYNHLINNSLNSLIVPHKLFTKLGFLAATSISLLDLSHVLAQSETNGRVITTDVQGYMNSIP